MGQRLNFKIVHNSETIMSCYKHWSAYTIDSAEYAADFVDAWISHRNDSHSDAIDDDELLALRLIDAFAELNAGFDNDEMNRLMNAFCQEYPELEMALRKGRYHSINRNEGLLSVTQEGIAETEYWEDGRITYDIDSGTIDFQIAYYEGDSYEDFCESYKQEYNKKYPYDDNEIPLIDFDFSAIPENDMRKVAEVLANDCSNGVFKTRNGYCTMII